MSAMPEIYSRNSSVWGDFLRVTHGRFSTSVLPTMKNTKKNGNKPRPYMAKGAKLRARRKALQREGLLSSFKAIAKQLRLTESAILQWERGETWPTAKYKEKLADLLRWSVQELDYGPSINVREDNGMLHPVTQQELSLLALFRTLADEERKNVVHDLQARAITQQTLSIEVKGVIKPPTDAQVEQHLGRPKQSGQRKKDAKPKKPH